MNDGIGLAEVLLGLPGFRVLDVVETDCEVVIAVESTARSGVLPHVRGARRGAGSDARSMSAIWRVSDGRRGWCGRSDGGGAGSRVCAAKTWTEHSEQVGAQAVLTRRAGVEACRQVGENARPVSQLADQLAVFGGRS